MRDKKFNSYLIENTIQKRTLIIIVLVSWIVFTVFTTRQMSIGNSWIEIGGVLCFFSSLLTIYPLTERWRYRAWQNKPTKIEYTFLK